MSGLNLEICYSDLFQPVFKSPNFRPDTSYCVLRRSESVEPPETIDQTIRVEPTESVIVANHSASVVRPIPDLTVSVETHDSYSPVAVSIPATSIPCAAPCAALRISNRVYWTGTA